MNNDSYVIDSPMRRLFASLLLLLFNLWTTTTSANATPDEGLITKPEFLLHDTFPITSLAWSPDGRYIASGGLSLSVREVHIWDVARKKLVATLRLQQAPPDTHSITWSPDSSLLSLCDNGDLGHLRIFQASDWKEVKVLDEDQALGCRQSVYNADGSRIAILGKKVIVVSTSDWRTVQTIADAKRSGHLGLANPMIAYAADTLLIAGDRYEADSKTTGQVWYVAEADASVSRSTIAYDATTTRFGGTLYALTVSPDNKTFATGTVAKQSVDQIGISVHAYSLASGELLRTYLSQLSTMNPQRALAYTASGKYLVIGHYGPDGSIHICDVQTGKIIDTVHTAGFVFSLSSPKTGDRLAATSGSDIFAWHIN